MTEETPVIPAELMGLLGPMLRPSGQDLVAPLVQALIESHRLLWQCLSEERQRIRELYNRPDGAERERQRIVRHLRKIAGESGMGSDAGQLYLALAEEIEMDNEMTRDA